MIYLLRKIDEDGIKIEAVRILLFRGTLRSSRALRSTFVAVQIVAPGDNFRARMSGVEDASAISRVIPIWPKQGKTDKDQTAGDRRSTAIQQDRQINVYE